MRNSKIEQMLIELTEVRHFIIDTKGESQSNPLQVWYSPRKREFSLHFLGTLVGDEKLIRCLQKAQDVAVKMWNENNRDSVDYFPDLFNKIHEHTIRSEVMKEIAELEEKLNKLKSAYQL